MYLNSETNFPWSYKYKSKSINSKSFIVNSIMLTNFENKQKP